SILVIALLLELLEQLAAQRGQHAFYLELGGRHPTFVFGEYRDTFVKVLDDFSYRGGGKRIKLIGHWKQYAKNSQGREWGNYLPGNRAGWPQKAVRPTLTSLHEADEGPAMNSARG